MKASRKVIRKGKVFESTTRGRKTPSSLRRGKMPRIVITENGSTLKYIHFQETTIAKRDRVINNATIETEKLAAIERLKMAGILDSNGEIAKHYK